VSLWITFSDVSYMAEVSCHMRVIWRSFDDRSLTLDTPTDTVRVWHQVMTHLQQHQWSVDNERGNTSTNKLLLSWLSDGMIAVLSAQIGELLASLKGQIRRSVGLVPCTTLNCNQQNQIYCVHKL